MKVLHVIDSGGLYGAELVLLNLAKEQRRLGLAPTLLSIGRPQQGEKAVEAEARRIGVPVVAWRMRSGPNLIGARRILEHARTLGVDLVHNHGYKGNILFAALPRRLRRIPVITTLHGWTGVERWSRSRLYRWLECRLVGRLDGLVWVSERMAQAHRSAIQGRAPTYVVDNGIAPAAAAPDDEARAAEVLARFAAGRRIVGAVGRLSPEKGFDIFVEAVRILVSRGRDMVAVIAGEGPCREDIERSVRGAGLAERVRLLGYCRNASMWMRHFDVFVLSSRSEGLPVTVLEAMAAAVPVVATRVGGVPDALDAGSAGALVEPGNAAALADAIDAVLADRAQARSLAQAAQRRFMRRYSSARMAGDYLRVYQEVTHRNSHSCNQQ